jgi:putative oxidoreductase
MNIKASFNKLESTLTSVGNLLQCIVLLAIRLFWGWGFFQAGWGKLTNLDRTAGFFESLSIPLPKLNAIMAAGTECLGGLLLIVGLASRVVSVPLMFVMMVAYATADKEALQAIFSDPDKFLAATPFLFLLACVIIFVSGPGKLSLDALLKRPGVSK